MNEQSSRPVGQIHVKRWALLGIAVTVLATVALILLRKWPANTAPDHPLSDASALIGTLITLYALFLGGFTGLVGFVVKARASPPWKVVAVEFLIAAAILDLVRIWDATTHDLFKAATVGLSPHEIRDDINDFNHFFFVNVIVVAFAVLAACLRPFPFAPQAPVDGSDRG